MLQELFYISVIVLAVSFTIAILLFIFIAVKLYRKISELVDTASEKVTTVSDTIAELGEKGSDVVSLFTKRGQQAVSTSTLLALAMNAYFLLRTIFRKRR